MNQITQLFKRYSIEDLCWKTILRFLDELDELKKLDEDEFLSLMSSNTFRLTVDNRQRNPDKSRYTLQVNK